MTKKSRHENSIVRHSIFKNSFKYLLLLLLLILFIKEQDHSNFLYLHFQYLNHDIH